MEIIERTSALMPGGVPDFKEVRSYPTVKQLIQQEGRKVMLSAIGVMVNDLCESVNVVRNMTLEQQYEATIMLLDECGDFRLEDFQIMFTLGKRQQLVKIMDRLDISVISVMMDEYYTMRADAGRRLQEEEYKAQERVWKARDRMPATTEEEKEMERRFSEVVKGLKNIERDLEKEKQQEEERQRRQKMIEEYAISEKVDINQILQNFKGHNTWKKDKKKKDKDNG